MKYRTSWNPPMAGSVAGPLPVIVASLVFPHRLLQGLSTGGLTR
ncbi:hypothetical protein [Plantactinospora sp. CA-290183]